MRRIARIAAPAAVALVAAVLAIPLSAQQAGPGAETYKDIQATLGSVPGMFKAFPEAGIAGAWAEFKSIQLNPQTELSGKVKELIGLAVAAQVPCTYCVYFHTAAARLNGATDGEIKEAIAMAAITRHWSTVLNGANVEYATFKAETDAVLARAAEQAKAAKKTQ